MKSIIYMMILMFSAQVFAQKLTLDNMVGTHKLSPVSQINYFEPGMSLEYELAISKNKDEFDHNIIGVNEYIVQKGANAPKVTISKSECQGTAELTPEKLVIASLSCSKGRYLELRINLSQIENINAGTANKVPVFSTLLSNEIPMKMQKLLTTI